MEYVLVHSIPGRARLRVPEIFGNEPLGAALADWLAQWDGVQTCRANALCASVVICYDPAGPELLACIQVMLSGLSGAEIPPAPNGQPASVTPSTLDRILEFLDRPASLFWPTASLALTMMPFPIAALALPLMAFNAFPSLKRAFIVLRWERRLNVDFLDSLAITITAVRGQFFTGAFMIWMIRLGDWIRDKTAARSKRAITDLLGFQTAQTWIQRGKKVVRVDVRQVLVRQIVVVYPGEIIPVDG